MLAQAVTFLALAGAALAQTLSINTPPSIQQCQPAALQITGGTAPYILAAIPQSQPTAAALLTIVDNLNSQSYTWTVNLPVNTAINIRVTDATGAINYSSGLTVQQGSSGCLSGSSASGSSAVTSAVAASSGAGTSAPAASTTNASSVASSVAAAASSTSRAASSAAAAASSGAASSGNAASSAASSAGAATSSRPATSSGSAAGVKAAFEIPVLALAGAAAFTFLGGFAALA